MTARRAVFLDRDGVLVREIVVNGQALAPMSLSAFRLMPEAAAQTERLRQAGLTCLVFTNQPEVGRGLLPADTLEAMHRQLRETVPVNEIYVCPHDDADGCSCRKPGVGMLTAAVQDWEVRLEESFVIGDRWRDVEAGRAAGCFTVLIERPYSACETADVRVDSLTEAVDTILARLAAVTT
ncbi:MAG: HAD-IIIA family hydrolase [Chloroflexota bacterium]|nr:HAD-IIIA family hydrolase [Chloroflexota bacterium]